MRGSSKPRAGYLPGRSLLVGGEEGPWERVLTGIELRKLELLPALEVLRGTDGGQGRPGRNFPIVAADAMVEGVTCALDLAPPPGA